MQYKSVAGPVGLKVHSKVSYEEAVNQYAHIINKQAVDGWKLHWIQQVPATKSSPSVGGVLGLAALANFYGLLLSGNILIIIAATIVGGVLGFFVIRQEKPEYFDMLIFSKEEEAAGI